MSRDRLHCKLVLEPRRAVIRKGIVVAIFCACVHTTGVSFAAEKAPTVSHLFPAGGQRGADVTTQIHGDFDWPLKVHASAGQVEALEEKGQLRVSIPRNFPSNRIWLRFFNDAGASTRIPFLVDNLRELKEVEPNDSPSSPQRLADLVPAPNDSNVIVNGILNKDNDVDGYSVQLRKGETLVAALAANAYFESPMDAILQITTTSGTVVAENHDDVGLDPRLGYTAPKDGIYIVRVFAFPAQPNQSIKFHGGNNYVYRLTLTTGPFITHCLPLSVHEQTQHVVPQGWNIPPKSLLPFATLVASHSEFAAKDFEGAANTSKALLCVPGWASSAILRRVGSRCISSDGCTRRDEPLVITPPISVSGVVRGDSHENHYRVSLKKEVTYQLEVDAQELNSPLVPAVTLLDTAGKVAIESSVTGADKDYAASFQPEQDGEYSLVVRDRYGNSGERHFYRITIQPRRTDFSLSVPNEQFVLQPNDPLELEVTVQRRQFGGEEIGKITIHALDLPKSVKCEPVVSEPEGDSSKKIKLSLTSESGPVSGAFRVQGVAENGLQRFATSPTRLQTRFQRFWLTVTEPPTEVDSD